MEKQTESFAVLAGGCFWCTEGIFQRLKGVSAVVSGYANSNQPNPSYRAVCEGKTGAAEAIRIMFDPTVLPYEKLLEIFWHTHNPTTKNQQGNDFGTQYRSAIFYADANQRQIAEKTKRVIEQSKLYDKPVLTEITPLENFSVAEDYHQNYYNKNGSAPYCSVIIDPKIQKLLQEFGDAVKDEYRHGAV